MERLLGWGLSLPVKPLVKRSGGLTYVRPGYGVTGRISNVVAYPLYPRSRGQIGPPPRPRGEGGGRTAKTGPSPIPSLELAEIMYGTSELKQKFSFWALRSIFVFRKDTFKNCLTWYFKKFVCFYCIFRNVENYDVQNKLNFLKRVLEN
jgi:hypothetical protein